MAKRVVLTEIGTFERKIHMLVEDDLSPKDARKEYLQGEEPYETEEWEYLQTDLVDIDYWEEEDDSLLG